jgi:hypothetical protein
MVYNTDRVTTPHEGIEQLAAIKPQPDHQGRLPLPHWAVNGFSVAMTSQASLVFVQPTAEPGSSAPFRIERTRSKPSTLAHSGKLSPAIKLAGDTSVARSVDSPCDSRHPPGEHERRHSHDRTHDRSGSGLSTRSPSDVARARAPDRRADGNERDTGDGHGSQHWNSRLSSARW